MNGIKERTRRFSACALLVFLCLWLPSCLMVDGGDGEIVPDTNPPGVFILSPTTEDILVTTENTITISGVAQDESDIQAVTYMTSRGVSGVAEGLEEWTIPQLPLMDGDNFVIIFAIDKNNNSGTASIVITKNKYLTFIDVPYVDKKVLFTNESAQVWITASLIPSNNLIESSVRLIEVDESYHEVGEICSMYDDGQLALGDEIKGDNTFSALHTFSFNKEGTYRYRVCAKSVGDGEEFEDLSSVFTITVMDEESVMSQIQTIMDTQKEIENKVKSLAGLDLTADKRESILREFLEKLDNIGKVERIGSDLKVTHKSGFVSFIEIEKDEDALGFGGATEYPARRKATSIPLNKQTRGDFYTPVSKASVNSTPSKEESEDYILNKNILVWAPVAYEYKNNIPSTLPDVINKLPVKLNPTYLYNEECTIQSLRDLPNYGVIIFETHGAEGYYLRTGQRVEYDHDYFFIKWGDNHAKLGLIEGEYTIVTKFGVSYDGVTLFGVSYYAVTSKFFENKENFKGKNKKERKLPNSLVYNSSCGSLSSENLAQAFVSMGAGAYLGYSATVLYSTSSQKAKDFFSSFLGVGLKNAGESLEAMTSSFYERGDETVWYNSLLMRGNPNLRFYLGLLNGDFEKGNLSAWNATGDGRVATSLGPLRPTQGTYMGLVSTGLGYTVDYGKISQTFYISDEKTLSIRWNFLSEEFMEYVGSEYQDYLRVYISDGTDTRELFRKSIDVFANQFSMTSVSPDIVFDQGDVYMTGWQTSTYDISEFRGKTVTLIIESGDIGDSIYDSATLLDEISIK